MRKEWKSLGGLVVATLLPACAADQAPQVGQRLGAMTVSDSVNGTPLDLDASWADFGTLELAVRLPPELRASAAENGCQGRAVVVDDLSDGELETTGFGPDESCVRDFGLVHIPISRTLDGLGLRVRVTLQGTGADQMFEIRIPKGISRSVREVARSALPKSRRRDDVHDVKPGPGALSPGEERSR